jgi:hypothetical protein
MGAAVAGAAPVADLEGVAVAAKASLGALAPVSSKTNRLTAALPSARRFPNMLFASFDGSSLLLLLLLLLLMMLLLMMLLSLLLRLGLRAVPVAVARAMEARRLEMCGVTESAAT